MSEDYFLYFEEPDWVYRGKEKGWKIGYDWQTKVFHKEGGSIGTSSSASRRSGFSEYWGFRSRLLFMQKQGGKSLWLTLIFVMIVFNRLRRFNVKNIAYLFKAFKNFINDH